MRLPRPAPLLRVALAVGVAALLSGCLAEPATDTSTATTVPADEGGLGGRTARGGQSARGNATVVQEEMVEREIFSQSIQIVGGAEPVTFDVDVPAGASKVTYSLAAANLVSSGSLRIELTDCGLATDPTIAVGIGGSQSSGSLCQQVAPGKHVLTIDDPGGYLEGTISLAASFPA